MITTNRCGFLDDILCIKKNFVTSTRSEGVVALLIVYSLAPLLSMRIV